MSIEIPLDEKIKILETFRDEIPEELTGDKMAEFVANRTSISIERVEAVLEEITPILMEGGDLEWARRDS